jgi:hypothetical protein
LGLSAKQAASILLMCCLFRFCRFGPLGMRVFNTLLHNGQLEPKQIADFIMREHKETRELLYRMLKAGYLQMQVSD